MFILFDFFGFVLVEILFLLLGLLDFVVAVDLVDFVI